MTSACQAVRGEIRRAAQLHDALRDLVGMSLFFVRMVEKFLSDTLRMNAACHEMMTPVAQYTHEFRCQRIIEQLEYDFAVRGVARCNGPLIEVLASALA